MKERRTFQIETCISSRTAEFHKEAIMVKLGLRTIAQLTRYAIGS